MRTRHINQPQTLDHVLTNIIHDLEQRQQSEQDDLIIQALLGLQAMVGLERDLRHQRERREGSRT